MHTFHSWEWRSSPASSHRIVRPNLPANSLHSLPAQQQPRGEKQNSLSYRCFCSKLSCAGGLAASQPTHAAPATHASVHRPGSGFKPLA